jgi:hypothetical protein
MEDEKKLGASFLGELAVSVVKAFKLDEGGGREKTEFACTGW